MGKEGLLRGQTRCRIEEISRQNISIPERYSGKPDLAGTSVVNGTIRVLSNASENYDAILDDLNINKPLFTRLQRKLRGLTREMESWKAELEYLHRKVDVQIQFVSAN